MRIFITGHQGLGNRGCEALLRSTIELIRRRHPRATFFVPSQDPQADARQWPQSIVSGVRWIPSPQVTTHLALWARGCRLLPGLAASRWPLPRLSPQEESALDRSDLMLSIGGDNYTLDYDLASLALYVGMATLARQRGVPTVLWGASVGPFEAWPSVAQRMKRHLDNLTALTVRESCSAQVLTEMGVGGATADELQRPVRRQVVDPAFTLEPEAVDLEPHLPSGQGPLLGLNLSPFAAPPAPGEPAVKARARLLREATSFIRRAIALEGARILLVPHVSARDRQGQTVHRINAAQDDALLLDELVNVLGPEPRLRRLPTWSAPELKQAISCCDVFIGARTHAVIAALSSGVPAVALSYSLKARGIHRDLMDREDGVLDVRQLDADQLHQSWSRLLERAPSERVHLRGRLPHWRARAASAVPLLDQIVSQPPEAASGFRSIDPAHTATGASRAWQEAR